MSMTAKELAVLLDGREYGAEITGEEVAMAKDSRLVVLFGASDDLAEFRGAIHDEAGCYDGGTIYLDADGIFYASCENEGCKLLQRHLRHCKTIEAVWGDGLSWTYRTDIPHETFDVLEDGAPYCRGIVFELGTEKDIC